MLQEDNVKDDNGYRAVFAEQGASVSLLAAAKILDTHLVWQEKHTKQYPRTLQCVCRKLMDC